MMGEPNTAEEKALTLITMQWRKFRRRLRRLKDPVALVRWMRHNRAQQRSLDRQIRTHIDNPETAAVTVQRPRMIFPSSPEELKKADFFNMWWYYGAELLPSLSTKGVYPDDMSMLPRIMLRECDPAGQSFLEMGPMEGLMPVVMKRRGADRVLAVDAIDGCAEKMEALKHYYNVDFDFKVVGLMYDLHRKLAVDAFDIVNCSGLLYHVYSPLSILAGVRPLLKRNGLLVVSTPVIRDPGYFAEFNNAGRIQDENNTFWYVSVPLLDYMLRYLALAPIDCCFQWFSSFAQPHARLTFDKPSGYMSVVCRAVDDVLPAGGDQWMARSAEHSWEHRGLTDWRKVRSQPLSSAVYRRPPHREAWRADTGTIDLWKATETMREITIPARPGESHTLRLGDMA